jgi:hypothetical protein
MSSRVSDPNGLARVHEACQQFVHRYERCATILASSRGFAECEELRATLESLNPGS